MPPVSFQMRKVSMLPKSRSPASAAARAPGHVVQNPAELEAAEVGGQRQTGAGAIAVLPAVGAELGNGIGDAGVLPDDGVADGLAGFAVPHHGGLALVGDADAR